MQQSTFLKKGGNIWEIISTVLLGKQKPTQTPPMSGRVDSFKLSTADFESINLTEDSQVYLFLIKRVSHNN